MTVETSIIIRTLNEGKHLEKLLKGIHDQSYHDWEIVLVDSGSTDGTLDIAGRYGASIHHIPQTEFTYGRSLNFGCRNAQGFYLVFASGHVWPITNNWLGNLVRPFDEPSVGMVYGRQRGTNASRLSEQRDLDAYYGTTSSILVNEPKGNNGNAAIRRDLWLRQSFDECLPALEDVDWVNRIQREGFRVYYAADAAVYHLHEESLKQVYRRHLRESIAYQEMFPSHRVTWGKLAKGLAYLMLRDLLYASRGRKRGKVLQIPGTRLAEMLGMYRGAQYQKRMSRRATRELEIPETYQSVVIDGPGRHGMRQVALPRLDPDEVLIQIAYVGVCATDLEVANGRLAYYQKGLARYPIVPGHEYSGIVVGSGGRVKHLPKGIKVVGECAVGCDHCPACDVGEYYRCESREEVGVINRSGAYAHYLVMPSRYVHKLPHDVPLRHGALVEPIAVCLKGLRKLSVEPGHSACVVGAGPIGNLCVQILRYRGIPVTAVDRDPRRLNLLYKYDIDTLTELGDLDKFDYIVEASGNETILPQLIEGSKPSAKLLLLGLPYTRPVETTFSSVTSSDKVIYGSIASHRNDWKEAIRLVQADGVRLDDHTAVIQPLEAYEKAWASLETRDHFKTLLKVSNELDGLWTG